MPEQEQKRIQKKGGSDDAATEDAGQVSASSKAAEEFVKSYVQKGGQ